MPKRIQRKRTKGWQMPPNTVYVGRPTKWGNPFPVGGCEGDRLSSVDAYRRLFTEPPRLFRHAVLQVCAGNQERGEGAVLDMKLSLDELRGKDLACWCPLTDKHDNYMPCHADVLLELANAPR